MSKRKETRQHLSRREFVKTASIGAAAAAGAGAAVLSGCDEGEYSENGDGCEPCIADDINIDSQKWDMETDVIVVGSGSGLVAALAASLAGKEVLVLEKEQVIGGASGLSASVFWIPNNSVMKKRGLKDSRENAIAYIRSLAEGQATDELIEAFVDGGPEMVDFIRDNTSISWTISAMITPVCDFHVEFPGGVRRGRSIMPALGSSGNAGNVLIKPLVDALTASGGEILRKSPVRRLITRLLDDGRQEVLGVVAEEDGDPINIKARCGVVLAAGGFDWNDDLLKHFLRGPRLQTLIPSSSTGDGILMAMQAGADLRNMNECWGSIVYKEAAAKARANGNGAGLFCLLEKALPGSMIVNRFGKRFCNEAAGWETVSRTFFNWINSGEDPGYQNIPGYLIYDNKTNPGNPMGNPTIMRTRDGVVRAGSLAELAQKLNIDSEALEKTVADFNEHAKLGKDPEFHRGETVFDRGGGNNAGNTLGPMNQPPFFSVEVAPATIGTCGGARVNGNAQVISPFNQPIPRLYAGGNNAGVGGPGAGYGGPGCCLGSGFSFAYLAGKHIATLDPWG